MAGLQDRRLQDRRGSWFVSTGSNRDRQHMGAGKHAQRDALSTWRCHSLEQASHAQKCLPTQPGCRKAVLQQRVHHTFQLPDQAVLCARHSSERLGPLALASLCQLGHHAAEQAPQLQAPAAAHVGMWAPLNRLPAEATNRTEAW